MLLAPAPPLVFGPPGLPPALRDGRLGRPAVADVPRRTPRDLDGEAGGLVVLPELLLVLLLLLQSFYYCCC